MLLGLGFFFFKSSSGDLIVQQTYERVRSFGTGDSNITNKLNASSFNYIYENITIDSMGTSIRIPAWSIEVTVPKFCYANTSCVNAHNTTLWFGYSKKEVHEERLMWRTGVEMGDEVWKGNVNVDGEILSIWTTTINSKDMKTDGICKEFEVNDGSCRMFNLSKILEVKE